MRKENKSVENIENYDFSKLEEYNEFSEEALLEKYKYVEAEEKNLLNLENIFYKIPPYIVYYHLFGGVENTDLVAIEIDNESKEIFVKYFEFLIPINKSIDFKDKLWFYRSDADILRSFCKENALESRFAIFALLQTFMLDYGFDKDKSKDTIEYGLSELYSSLISIVENSLDEFGAYTQKIEPPLYEIVKVSIKLKTKKTPKGTKTITFAENIHFKNNPFESDYNKKKVSQNPEFNIFKELLSDAINGIAQKMLNSFNLTSIKNTGNLIAKAFFDFMKDLKLNEVNDQIYELFIYFYFNSNHKLDGTSETGLLEDEIDQLKKDRINKVKSMVFPPKKKK